MRFNKIKASIMIVAIAAISITTGVIISSNLNKVDVHLGYLQGDIHHLAFFVAESKGYYEDEGLRVQTYQFSNGGMVMNAFESLVRTIDMSYLGFAPAIAHKFNAENANITVIAAANVNGSALVVKNDGSINTISDLNGKVVAVPTYNNMQDFILRLALDTEPTMTYEGNITSITSHSVPNMGLVLDSGDISGYVAWEPYNARHVVGENAPGKYLMNSSDLWPNHPCCVIASHNDFLENNPETVRKVLTAHVKATMDILNPSMRSEILQIAVDRLGISHEVAEIAMDNVGYVYEPDLTKMVEFLDKLVQFGTVSMDSDLIPNTINSHSEFIDFFIDTTILSQITSSL